MFRVAIWSVALLALLAAAAVGAHDAAAPHAHTHAHVDHTDGHHCIHDELVRALDHKPRVHDRIVPEGAMELLEVGTEAGAEQTGLRVHMDFRYMQMNADVGAGTSGIPRSCYFTGQQYRVYEYTQARDVVHVCTQDDVITLEKMQFVQEIANDVAAWLQTALAPRRRPADGRLRLDQGGKLDILKEYSFPQSYHDTPVVGDVVLFFTGRPTTGNTLAWALSSDWADDVRPLAGHVNIGIAKLYDTPRAKLFKVLLHEVLHALGFSGPSLNFFVDESGEMVCPTGATSGVCDGVYERTTTLVNGKQNTITEVVTPHVQREARAHFGCPSLRGAEVENSGGSGTAGSHWETRVFANEVMTGSIKSGSLYPVSGVTLAFMQDSGWYTVRYEMAEYLKFGHEAGCSFVQQKCNEWSEDIVCVARNGGTFAHKLPESHPQIGSADPIYCTADRMSKATCPLVRINNIENWPWWQYFTTDPQLTGSDELWDRCPVIVPFTEGSCLNAPPASSTWAQYSPDFEKFGAQSRCVEAEIKYTKVLADGTYVYTNRNAYCFEHKCSGGVPYFKVDNCDCSAHSDFRTCPCWMKCDAEGEKTFTPYGTQYESRVWCPAAGFCTTEAEPTCPANCNGRGDCSGGVCACHSGWTGVECSLRRCPNDCSMHGTCDTGTGVCACVSGFGGDDCSHRVCPDHCSGGGTCDTSTGECTCHAGRAGTNCALRLCPNSCTGNGACDYTTGTCSCFGRWEGTACDVRRCIDDCNGRGSCSMSTGVCQCNAPFSGEACELRECPADCNLRGVCNTQSGECTCQAGFGGVSCGEHLCPFDCSGHGTCNKQTGECACAAEWEGAGCQYAKPKTCPAGCVEHGRCDVSTGACLCDPGFEGPACQLRSCAAGCDVHGSCNHDTGACHCDAGFAGTACMERRCPSDCSGRGTCTNGACQCMAGFVGVACAERRCPNDCSGQGACDSSTGTCSCMNGYTGAACSLRTCPANCNGNGQCDSLSGACVCAGGWTGDDCGEEQQLATDDEVVPSPAPAGTPQCPAGYTGADCTTHDCKYYKRSVNELTTLGKYMAIFKAYKPRKLADLLLLFLNAEGFRRDCSGEYQRVEDWAVAHRLLFAPIAELHRQQGR